MSRSPMEMDREIFIVVVTVLGILGLWGDRVISLWEGKNEDMGALI